MRKTFQIENSDPEFRKRLLIWANRQDVCCCLNSNAEMQAFTSAANFLGGKYLNECTLFVTVEPCVMCAGASYWTQIGAIVFGTRDEKKGFLLVSKNILHPKTKLTGGVMEEECAALMKDFFRKKR